MTVLSNVLLRFVYHCVRDFIPQFQHKCYIVATCDRDLRNRIRKVPGVPIMYIRDHRFTIERMPDAFGAPKF